MMTAQQLHDLLEAVPDTREIVVVACAHEDGLLAVWRTAHAEASRALDAWRAWPGPESFAAYRAAQDRADAAQDALAADGQVGSASSTRMSCASPSGVS